MDLIPQFPALRIGKVETMVFRVPIDVPVETSFGLMHDRPAVLVRVEDQDGAVGWGEIWCNFPSVGAEHRARVLASCIAPVLLGTEWRHPRDAYVELTRRLRVLAIQAGEPGTIAQAIAGVDIAMWDLAARRLGQPLWKLLGGSARVPTYASGLSPTAPEKLAAAKYGEGFRAFKLKVGFGIDRDRRNLRALREELGAAALMIDANQAWVTDEAIAMSTALEEFEPAWLEEPIGADSPLSEWTRLAQASPIPLAAGENMRGDTMFAEAIASKAFAVIQPDLAKWGGFSACLPVARQAIAAGRLFCPHWLGGGIGLLASLHLKGAVGGEGYAEIDANPNPLRDLLATPLPQMLEGVVTLSDRPGLGVEPNLQDAGRFLVHTECVS
ncbi:MAG: mandelate racemase [Bordetella sp. SCN 67-23]|nr:mandelate racemase/muconate lactonizing enzyme family protein [Burkholderiales bacterium]ODS72959.1 MAG: mandelate racemase [Bordetella sp. SCN 67-23]OJW93546.1 MAG: mandelate racemase [Burkholderiales bacterium 67-32]